MKLADLKQNQRAILTNCLEKHLPLKLLEMGCMDGVEIELLNKAPLGTPYYFLMGNTRIALGKEIVNELEVQLVNDDDTQKEA